MGCAQIAERSVIPAILEVEELQLAGVASRGEAKAKAFSERFNTTAYVGYDALLADENIDAIYMPLPTGLHAEWIQKCLAAGKHVLCEKSLTSTYAEAQQVLKAAHEAGKLVLEDFMFEHHAQMKLIKEIVASGRIGDLRCVRASFGFPPFPDADNIRYQYELGGGALLDAGGYPTKIAQLLLGNDLQVAGASLAFDPEKGVDIFGSAQLNSKSGVSAQLSWGFDNAYRCEIELWGSKATLLTTRIFTAKPGFEPEIIISANGQSETIKAPADNHFKNILRHFATTIHSGDFAPTHAALLSQSRLLSDIKNHATT